jgi:outer membrane protein TolC
MHLIPLALISVALLSLNPLAQPQVGIPDSAQLAHNRSILDMQMSGLIKETLAQNRSLRAASSRIDEADAAARRKSSLDPPRFEIGAMDASSGSFPNPFKDQMQMDYSLEQMVMFPGKLSTMKKAELKKKEMVQFDRTTLERELIYKIIDAFYEIYLIDRQIGINRESQALLSRIVDIARTQYEVGMGKQADILRAQAELSNLRKRLAGLEQGRQSMSGMINALRNKPVETPIDTTGEIFPEIFSVSFDKLRAEAAGNRPELKAMQANLAMKKTELTVANLEWYPDFMVKGTYSDKRPIPSSTDAMSLESGSSGQKNPDTWSIMLGVTIPEAPWTFGKSSSAQNQAKASITGAEADLDEMYNMVQSEIFDAFTQVQSTIQQLRLAQKTLLPQAQQAFESALASYRTGGQEFTMLLDAQRMLLMARDDYHMTVMNYLVSLAKLERATGTNLETITNGGQP